MCACRLCIMQNWSCTPHTVTRTHTTHRWQEAKHCCKNVPQKGSIATFLCFEFKSNLDCAVSPVSTLIKHRKESGDQCRPAGQRHGVKQRRDDLRGNHAAPPVLVGQHRYDALLHKLQHLRVHLRVLEANRVLELQSRQLSELHRRLGHLAKHLGKAWPCFLALGESLCMCVRCNGCLVSEWASVL